MKKLLFIFCLILFSFLSFTIAAQTVKKRSFLITSFEGKQVKIIVYPDCVHNMLTIKLGHHDSICINEYMDEDRHEKIKILNKKFIVVPFEMRGGSGESLSRTLILCLTKGRLHIAFMGFSEDWAGGAENDQIGTCRFKVISINTDSLNGYRLIAKQYQKITSTHHPKRNYVASDTLYFKFDRENKVFYNKSITLNGNYVIDSTTSHRDKNFKSETYPAIEIKRHNYLFEKQKFMDGYDIFMNGKWYGANQKNHLSLDF